MLICQVERLVREDTRIDEYPKMVRGESRTVWEWQAEGAVFSPTLRNRKKALSKQLTKRSSKGDEREKEKEKERERERGAEEDEESELDNPRIRTSPDVLHCKRKDGDEDMVCERNEEATEQQVEEAAEEAIIEKEVVEERGKSMGPTEVPSPTLQRGSDDIIPVPAVLGSESMQQQALELDMLPNRAGPSTARLRNLKGGGLPSSHMQGCEVCSVVDVFVEVDGGGGENIGDKC
ncbi:hypothetical protein CBR_g30426 [Chara braunii]|uniref:Uncharacterized protein n=1 Tax=Chara braunii TaxID=69332 RepID=A0A388LCN3_CHABU|nr:hypothetical protein CBR_g30426 [Chara braunii]|eukprot:GBG80060.1 hypothetical protein CBR_g30426 [Chara braunii]